MEITVNGELHTVPETCTAQDLLEILDLRGGRLAMEINLEILPRSNYPQHQLRAGDRVEIVHAVGGG